MISALKGKHVSAEMLIFQFKSMQVNFVKTTNFANIMSLTVQVDKQNSKTAHYDNNHNHNHHSTNVQTILIFHFVFPLFIFSKTRQFMRCCCSNRSSCSVLFNSCIHLEPVSDSRFQIHSLSVVPSEQLPKIIMRRRKKNCVKLAYPIELIAVVSV